jgi:type II secretory pathway pseudopilin PulG
VELFAADAGIIGALAVLGVAVAASVRKRQSNQVHRAEDEQAEQQLSSLKKALNEFQNATNNLRAYVVDHPSDQRLPPDMHDMDELGVRVRQVHSRAIDLFVAASTCGSYGEQVVQKARRLMRAMGIDFPEESLASVELAVTEAELNQLRPYQVKQLFAKQQ